MIESNRSFAMTSQQGDPAASPADDPSFTKPSEAPPPKKPPFSWPEVNIDKIPDVNRKQSDIGQDSQYG